MKKRRPQAEGGKFRKALKISAIALSLAVVIAGFVFIWESGVFELREVVFFGNSYLSDKELKAVIGEEISLFTPLGRIAGKLEASPWIKDVKLRKEYPGLVVKIKEAVPVAFLQKQTGYFLISDEGLMLERLEGAVPFLPVIVSEIDGGSEVFQEAVYLARVLKETGIPSEMERVEITGLEKGAENLALSLDGVPVKVGKGQYEEKLLRLLELSDEIKKREISVDFIDLRFADRVVVKAVPEVLK